MKPYFDGHCHTTNSDGRLTPQEVLKEAYAAGIRCLSITDHNFITDVSELCAYAKSAFEEEMTLVQGAEISACYVDAVTGTELEVHIVALGINPDDSNLKALLKSHFPDRKLYVDAILQKLKNECGIDLGTYESIRARFPTSYVGRMLLARLLTDQGITETVDDAFNIYLGCHGERRAYIKNPFRYSSLETVVRTIIRASGIPVLAHLLYYDFDESRLGGDQKERLVRRFKELVDSCHGVGGMEVFYARYTPTERLYLLQLARKYGLLFSGGSDFHGQEGEHLGHQLSCSACSDLLEHLGIKLSHPLPPGKIYVLSGFSGVGKGTVCQHLQNMQIDGKPVALIQSCTTRPPRSPNDHYTFLSRNEFDAMAKAGLFLEYDECDDFYAQEGYATPAEDVKAAMESGAVLLEINQTGLMRLLTDAKINPDLVRSVFLAADASEVEARLCHRGTESRSKIRSRLEAAIEESRCLDLYDAVIVNNDVKETAEAVIRVFEGHSPENTFDPVRFRAEMMQLLTFYEHTPEDKE